jgi:hypothetical protein
LDITLGADVAVSRNGGIAVAIDYSVGFAFPKGRVKALDKQDKQAALEALDKKESAKAKKRAGGRCEVRDLHVRCWRKDVHTHHLISGIGKRNRGEKSILSTWKLRVCQMCHDAIHTKILKPTTADADASTVRFWRAR